MLEPDDGSDAEYETGDLPPFADLVAGLGDIDDEDDESGVRSTILDIERVAVSLAIECAVDVTEDALRVLGSTPTQWTETTVMPVFHKLTMHIEKSGDGEE
jgi:hypothetical protein